MSPVELLEQNLPVEPDLQNFVAFVLLAVERLGGNRFCATGSALALYADLRGAGAGTGYPLPARIVLDDCRVYVAWENGRSRTIATVARRPDPGCVEELRQHLLQSTSAADPALLLRRNEEMERYLGEVRRRTEEELERLQETLAQRQDDLLQSIRAAETDALTGLLNRRAYDDRLDKAYRRSLRQGEALSLLLIDLDYFKQINDEFGHQEGDRYLQKTAESMRSIVRAEVDLAFRFGGDEFALILFSDHATACAKAEMLLTLMGNRLSIGIASTTTQEDLKEPLEDFVRRADGALYAAKRSGRGRWVLDLPDPGRAAGTTA